VGAVYSFRSDDSQKLEEIRALLAENNRLQRIDLHQRAYKHPLLKACDFGAKCEDFSSRFLFHNVEISINKFGHPFSEECGGSDGCAKAEQVWRQAMKERQEKQDGKK